MNPEEDIAGMHYKLSEILDLNELQMLLEKFSAATHIASSLLDLEGNVLAEAGGQHICAKYHQVHIETSENCHKSDAELIAQQLKGEHYALHRCLNGLVDAATPVIINEVHVAHIFIGQFFLEEPDLEFFRKQAKKYGFPERTYVQAVADVPVYSRDVIGRQLDFLSTLAGFLAEMSMNRRMMQKMNAEQEQHIQQRTQELRDAQIATMNMMQDAVELQQVAESANEELRRLLKEVNRSNEELEQFAYVASHDLQEPLRKIQSFGNLLFSKYGASLDQVGTDYLRRMLNASGRAQQLISDLLAFSRIGTRGLPFEEVDLEMVFTNVLEDLDIQIAEKNAVVIKESELPSIDGDATQLRQLFQNLISNAIKFSRKDVDPDIHIRSRIENERVYIGVQDNGIGIDPKYTEKIFIIFQRLHNRTAYSGTGIGLALCKKIVERHRGRISVESEEGKGATFQIELPLRQSGDA